MAQSWLTGYLKHILLNLLSSPEIKLVSQQLHISNHLDMIRDSLWAINAVIVDACVRALKESKLKKWLQDVVDTLTSMEDILEGLQEEQKQEVTPPNLLHHDSISSTSTLFLSPRRHAILVELKQIAQSLNCLLSRAVAFGLLIDMINSMDPNQAEYYSILLQEVVGRDDDVERILQIIFQLEEEQLPWDINNDVPFAIVITGKQGLGKSILARVIYHHPLVCEFFKHRIWVNVSNCALFSFEHRQIARECARHLSKRTSSDVDIWSLIHSSLPRMRCLLILDGIMDLTRENKDKWVELKKNLLSSSAPGSRVIITCESYDIFKNNQMVHSDKVYKLSNIAQDAMTKLVLRYFKSITQCDRLEQNSSTIKMTDMLHLASRDFTPLETKLHCSIMGNFKVHYTKLVQKYSLYWELMTLCHDTYAITQVFRYILLFRPLPLSLFKDCFDMLITEGAFTYSRKAQQIFRKELIERINSETINLMYHDFHKNVYIWKRGGQESRIPHQCRYLCMFIESNTGNFLSNLQAGIPNNLRTLIFYRVKKEMDLQVEDNQVASSIEISKSLIKSLVILSIIDIGIQQLPNTIGMLLRLRYLYLSEKKIQELPESICDLRNLQVLCLSHCKKLLKLPEQIHNLDKLQMLKLGYCTRLQKLPKSITSLLNLQVLDVEACYWLNELPKDLRHLERLINLHIIGCASLTRMPIGISKLTNLEALSGYKIDYNGERSKLEELQTLTNIEQLHIRHLELLVNLNTIKSVNLEEKQYLENLLLHWEWWNMVERANEQLESFEVLDGLKPNVSNLKSLEIISYMDEKIPNWITSEYPPYNLVELRLINLKRCKKVQLSSLLCLESLEVSGMDSLAYMGVEGEYHPLHSLVKLILSEMPILEDWSYDCPSLKEVTLIHCPKLKIVRRGQVRRERRRETFKLTICLQSLISTKHFIFLGDNYSYVEELEIIGCHDLCSLHQVFPSLRSLSIIECSKLQALPDWLQKIHSLEHISVVRCKAISYIPDKLKDRVIIQGCPKVQAPTRRDEHFK